VVHTIIRDEERSILEEIGTEIGLRRAATYRIRPDDPLSARIDLLETFLHKRGEDWDSFVEATTALSSTADNFLAEATLKVLDGGKPIFLRSWLKKIPRNSV
jgi:hypothetical protein